MVRLINTFTGFRQVPLLKESALNLIRAFWFSELFRSGELRRGVWLRGWAPVDIAVVDMSPPQVAHSPIDPGS